MRIRIERAADRLPMPWYGFAVLGLFGAVAGTVYFVGLRTGAEWTLCTMKRFTGIPCAGCRGTRAGLRLLSGDVWGAFQFNPLLTAILLLVPVGLALRIGTQRTLRFELSRREKTILPLIFVILFLANWSYVIFMEKGM